MVGAGCSVDSWRLVAERGVSPAVACLTRLGWHLRPDRRGVWPTGGAGNVMETTRVQPGERRAVANLTKTASFRRLSDGNAGPRNSRSRPIAWCRSASDG